jgi:3-phosphoshikimate 1-carboxyvinyltransferase
MNHRMIYQISKTNPHLNGTIRLDGSKSISNRLLIIKALCSEPFEILNLSTSKDTVTLQKLLNQKSPEIYDAGAAGTTFRFMTAYLALQSGTQILTGSARMLQRPIGKLVEGLRGLGCDIEYMGVEGYPPLKIKTPKLRDAAKLSIDSGVSSQYISALLMIAPTLPQGLELTLEGKIVSLPYIQMTLALMQDFGVSHEWRNNTIVVAQQNYRAPAPTYTVEADWSAASYYYTLAAFAQTVDLKLNGLFKKSLQGDAVVSKMGESFGIETNFEGKDVVHLTKSGHPDTDIFEYDFIKCPDIAQTLAVLGAGKGVQTLFTGLETLFIKETDRVGALMTELAKVNVWLNKLPKKFSQKKQKDFYLLEGKAEFNNIPTFDTYEDHRMAMAFAPLGLLHPIQIADPEVVVKSYPRFWEDLKTLGFEIKPINVEVGNT